MEEILSSNAVEFLREDEEEGGSGISEDDEDGGEGVASLVEVAGVIFGLFCSSARLGIPPFLLLLPFIWFTGMFL